MADLFDREAEDILRDARAHMNPTVYDRGRVSQKLAATRRAWDGQSAVHGGALPDPFAPSAKLMAAAKFGSWKVIAGGVAGLMLASGAYLALPSAPSSSAEKGRPSSAVVAPPAQPSSPSLDVGSGQGADSAAAEIIADRARVSRAPEQALGASDSASSARLSIERGRANAAVKQRASLRRTATDGVIEGRGSARRGSQLVADDGASGASAEAVANQLESASKTTEAEAPAAPPAAVEAPPAKPAVDPLIEDLGLLQRAAQVLHRGDARSAQSLLREHASRFPQSEARLERHALAFAAACAIGDTKSADEHRATLLREAPKSALSARVRAGCDKTGP